MKLTHLYKRSLAFFMAAVMMFVLAGCSSAKEQQNEEYVSSVKKLVDSAVNHTRTMKTVDEKFNCHNESSANNYIHTLDELSDIYQTLVKLDATDKFSDLDDELSIKASSALSDISELKTLVTYAAEKEDDTLYQNDNHKLLDAYETNYSGLVDLSLEIQTRWRND